MTGPENAAPSAGPKWMMGVPTSFPVRASASSRSARISSSHRGSSSAAAAIQDKLAGSAALRGALAAFNAAPAHVPAAQRSAVEAAVGAVNSGPLGANAVPATVPGPGGKPVPFNPLQDVAFHSLSHAYSIGFIVCGLAGLLAAALAVAALRGRARETLLDPQTLVE